MSIQKENSSFVRLILLNVELEVLQKQWERNNNLKKTQIATSLNTNATILDMHKGSDTKNIRREIDTLTEEMT